MKARTGKILAVALTQFVMIGQVFAAIPRGLPTVQPNRSLVIKRVGFDFSKGFDIASVRPVQSLRETRSEDISKIIPADMTPTTNGSLVATQILDHSLSNWFNSEAVRSSSIGHTAHRIEKSMEGDLSFGGTQPESTKHSLKFSMKATQTRADVEYTGLTTAQVTYFVLQEKTNIEIREPVRALNTQVVYNDIASKEDRTQMVSLRWQW
jgi:hypothetical protein